MGEKDGVSASLSDAKSWEERWTKKSSFGSDNGRVAMTAADARGVRAFFKAVTSSNSDRRQRMAREVAVYRDIALPRVPRLIESNTQHVADKSHQLFYASELIDGRSLDKVVSEDRITPAQAVSISLLIAKTLASAHEAGVFHRDIKPDNIVLSSDNMPYLVDFGLAYLENATDEFETDQSEELGNRFLRLPEYNSGSLNKRDPRSDITHVVGVLFYMLTKIKPSGLRDDNGAAPHQSRNAGIMLKGAADLNYDRLLVLFDKGFQYEIDRRIQTVPELVEKLKLLSDLPVSDVEDEDVLAGRLQARLASASRISKLSNSAAVTNTLTFVQQQIGAVVRTFGDAFVISQTNARESVQYASTELTIIDKIDPQNKFYITPSVEVLGDELVLILAGSGSHHRTVRIGPKDRPGSDLQAVIRAFVIAGLEDVTSDTRFITPRELPLKTFPEVTHLYSDEQIPKTEASLLIRPSMSIEWFLPRSIGDSQRISWRLTNSGRGDAHDIRVFLPGIDFYYPKDLNRGESVTEERRFDDRTAYYEHTRAQIHALVEFRDAKDLCYRQFAEVHGTGIYKGNPADYATTQFDEPQLSVEANWITPDVHDRFRSNGPREWGQMDGLG